MKPFVANAVAVDAGDSCTSDRPVKSILFGDCRGAASSPCARVGPLILNACPVADSRQFFLAAWSTTLICCDALTGGNDVGRTIADRREVDTLVAVKRPVLLPLVNVCTKTSVGPHADGVVVRCTHV